jgi:hypothetical protein
LNNNDKASPYTVERALTSRLENARASLTRDAQDIAEAAARLAGDVDSGIATGRVNSLAQDIQQFIVAAARYAATKETVELYAAERKGGGS